MGALINILYYSVGSMLTGILLTIIGIVLMFTLIRLWWRNSTFTLTSILVGIVLFFFLSFQSVLLCGAITIKSYSDDVEAYINTLVRDVPDVEQFSTEESQIILDYISKEWPLVGYYVDLADFQGHTPTTIAKAMVDELRNYMNWFMFRRVCWSSLFAIVGAIVVIKTISIHNERGKSREVLGTASRSHRPVGHSSRRRMIRR